MLQITQRSLKIKKEKKKGYISAQSINPNRLITKNF